jgi:hypothetical protein
MSVFDRNRRAGELQAAFHISSKAIPIDYVVHEVRKLPLATAKTFFLV